MWQISRPPANGASLDRFLMANWAIYVTGFSLFFILFFYIVKAFAPGALQFELRQSVSTSERSIYHTQAGFEPTEARVTTYLNLVVRSTSKPPRLGWIFSLFYNKIIIF